MSNTPVTPQAPYFDDYNSDKGYVRVLFRPKHPVQTRELNQLQTMFQEQIGRFGDHIFDNGSVVIPGEVIYDTAYAYVKLTTPPASSPETYIGKTLNRGSTFSAKIVNYAPAAGSDPFTFFVRYAASDSVNNNQKFSPGESLSIESEIVNVAIAPDATGNGTAVHVKRGVYYFNSTFVLVLDQTAILSKYDATPTATVGLEIDQEIVTQDMDNTLLDNASGTLNFSAPGAHRLKMLATLVNKADLSSLDNFIQLIVVENGQVKEKARNVDYSILDQTLARRTYDESGDYVIDPFILSVREHKLDGDNFGVYPAGDEAKLALELDPGKAYVRGYEVQTISNRILETNKARQTANAQNATIFQPGGNYFIVDFDIPAKAALDTSTSYSKANLVNSSNAVVATAFVSFVRHHPNSTYYRVYVFGYSLTGAAVFSPTGNRIKISTTLDGSLVTTALQETANKSAVFALPSGAVADVSNVAFQKMKQLSGSGTGNTITSIAGLGAGESLFSSDEDAYGVVDSAGNIFTVLTVSLPSTMNLSGSPSFPVKIFAPVQKTSGSIKTKSVATAAQAGSYALDVIDLGKADVFNITSIIGPGSEDLTEYYRLETNQQDGYYGISKAVKIRPLPISSGSVNVNFEYFAHGAGEFFTVNSYPGSVNYADIPTFTTSDGREIKLVNAMDFRPRINDAGTGFSGSGSSYNNVVLPNGSTFFDYDYYLGRVDKVILSQDGRLSVIQGTPAVIPQDPKDQDNAITLYKITLGPYTFSKNDVKVETFNYRRYTMKDIGTIEKRVANLEYYTSFSLLEKDTYNRVITDDNGDELFKSGIVVDRFSGHNVGDVRNPDYKVAMDLENSEARPEGVTKAVSLDLNPAISTNYKLHNDSNVVTLPYTEIAEAIQPLATRLERINPFEVFSWTGSVRMVPESDYWFSDNRLPDVVTNQQGTFDAIQFAASQNTSNTGSIWNFWSTNWAGIAINALLATTNFASNAVRSSLLTTFGTVNNQTTTTVQQNRSVINRVDTRLVSDRIVSTSVIPFIRERKIEFTATGLKPFTRVYPFFDGVAVSSFVTPTGGVLGAPLISDASGQLSGTFNIPNTATVRFRTGERVFKLTDSASNDDAASETSTSTIYRATGVINTRQSSFVSVRTSVPVPQAINAATARRSVIGWIDPLAQSFLTDTPGGVYMTSIDLFFGPEVVSDGFPVTLQIRNMVNGYPGNEIIPFGEVVLDANSIQQYNSAAPVVANRFVATKFTFPAPVYIQENTEYCFVVLSNSPTRNLWVATLGQKDTASGQQVSKQPYAGVMFKSQNGSTWTADQTSDIKFRINRAQFETGVNSLLRFDNVVPFNDALTESNPFRQVLGNNPLYITIPSPGTVNIKVRQKSHGFENGDMVSLDLPTATPINGIPAVSLDNVSSSVSAVSIDEYTLTFALPTAGVSEGIGGGEGIIAPQKINYSVAQFIAEQLLQTGTEVNWSFLGTNKGGSSIDGNETPIILGENTQLPVVKKIGGPTDESVRLFARMVSNRENLSPMIDVNRMALIATSNRINTLSDLTSEATSGGAAVARYVTRSISLENAADILSIFVDVNRPVNTRIAVFARFDSSLPEVWTQMNVDGALPGETTDSTTFLEYKYKLDPGASFTQFAVKIVFYVDPTVTDPALIQAVVPRLRDFRAVAVAT